MTPERHSEAFLTDDRMKVWNPDFVRLLMERLGAGNVSSLADFGCGRAHWTRVLLPHLPQLAHCQLIDLDPTYLETAAAKLRELFDLRTINCIQASGDATGIASDSVDLVSCHTLLLHTPEPVRVLQEMFRVLKPGGKILVAEPVNTLNRLALSELFDLPRAVVLEYVDICLDVANELAAAGCDENIGHHLGTLLPAVGFEQCAFYQGDHCDFSEPPVRDPAVAWIPSLQNLAPAARKRLTERYTTWLPTLPESQQKLLLPTTVIIALGQKPTDPLKL